MESFKIERSKQNVKYSYYIECKKGRHIYPREEEDLRNYYKYQYNDWRNNSISYVLRKLPLHYKTIYYIEDFLRQKQLFVEFFYLSVDDRRLFAQNANEYLIST